MRAKRFIGRATQLATLSGELMAIRLGTSSPINSVKNVTTAMIKKRLTACAYCPRAGVSAAANGSDKVDAPSIPVMTPIAVMPI